MRLEQNITQQWYFLLQGVLIPYWINIQLDSWFPINFCHIWLLIQCMRFKKCESIVLSFKHILYFSPTLWFWILDDVVLYSNWGFHRLHSFCHTLLICPFQRHFVELLSFWFYRFVYSNYLPHYWLMKTLHDWFSTCQCFGYYFLFYAIKFTPG